MNPLHKRCSTCRKIKSRSEFSINLRAPDGRQYGCKTCHKKYGKKYTGYKIQGFCRYGKHEFAYVFKGKQRSMCDAHLKLYAQKKIQELREFMSSNGSGKSLKTKELCVNCGGVIAGFWEEFERQKVHQHCVSSYLDKLNVTL